MYIAQLVYLLPGDISFFAFSSVSLPTLIELAYPPVPLVHGEVAPSDNN
jgi:hypothetical protein